MIKRFVYFLIYYINGMNNNHVANFFNCGNKIQMFVVVLIFWCPVLNEFRQREKASVCEHKVRPQIRVNHVKTSVIHFSTTWKVYHRKICIHKLNHTKYLGTAQTVYSRHIIVKVAAVRRTIHMLDKTKVLVWKKYNLQSLTEVSIKRQSCQKRVVTSLTLSKVDWKYHRSRGGTAAHTAHGWRHVIDSYTMPFIDPFIKR